MPPATPKAIAAAKTKLLQAIADLSCIAKKKKTFEVKKVAESAGYSCITGKAVRAALKELKEEGIFERSKDEITLTDKGSKSLPAPDETNLPTDEKAQEKTLKLILKKDPSCTPMTNEEKTKIVFNILLDGKVHTRDDLAKAIGYARKDTKQFRNLLKRMKAIGALEDGTSSEGVKGVQFTKSLWPVGGRPGYAADSPAGPNASSDAEDSNEPPIPAVVICKRKAKAAPEAGGKKKKVKKD